MTDELTDTTETTEEPDVYTPAPKPRGRPKKDKYTPPPTDPKIELQANEDGTMTAVYAWPRFRFMFSDGRTLDVRAVRDDSDLRHAMLAHMRHEPDDWLVVAGVAKITE